MKEIGDILGRNQNFRKLWLASILSETGTATSMVALPLYVMGTTHSYALAGIVVSAGMIGHLVVRGPAGYVADRWTRRPLLMSGAIIASILMAVVAASVLWHPSAQYWLIGIAWTLLGFVGAGLSPVQSAALRSTLVDDEVQQGMSAWQSQYAGTMLVGPLVGGLLYTVSPVLPFALDAVSFLVEFLVLASLRSSLGGGYDLPSGAGEVTLGIRAVLKSRFLRVYSLTNALVNVASEGIIYAAIFWMTALGGVSVGVGFAILGVGSLLGSLMAVRLKSTRYQLMMASYAALFALVGFVGFVSYTPWIVIGLAAVAGALSQPPVIALGSHIMTRVPQEAMGRVEGGMSMIGSVFYPFGAAVTGVVAHVWSLGGAFAFWGALCCVPLIAATFRTWRLPAGGLDWGEVTSLQETPATGQ